MNKKVPILEKYFQKTKHSCSKNSSRKIVKSQKAIILSFNSLLRNRELAIKIGTPTTSFCLANFILFSETRKNERHVQNAKKLFLRKLDIFQIFIQKKGSASKVKRNFIGMINSIRKTHKIKLENDIKKIKF